jgi:hypothetical protein
MRCLVCIFVGLLLVAGSTAFAQPSSLEKVKQETLRPYDGPSEKGVDCSTLHGKVLCGYQGWFSTEGDGCGQGWFHWTKDNRVPTADNLCVDYWPDVSELAADERFATQVKYADGRRAELFSSYKKATVLRHFAWMREAGIDGVLVQRFASTLRSPEGLRKNNVVLANCREGANRNGRTYVVEYDLSGMRSENMGQVIEDWKSLRTRMKLGDDPAYLRHNGKPVVEVWGIGFNDGRRYTLDDCRRLLKALRDDGCWVICGVPTAWRTFDRDAVHDKALIDVIKEANVVSPWTVGRFGTLRGVDEQAARGWKPDMEWCRDHKLEYMPVVFPGFSWHNQHHGPLDQIPRQKGKFLWRQFCEAKRLGATMINLAMFDEVDEGTAIFKCTNDPPTGGGVKLLTFDGLPSDYYLKLTGLGTRLLRGEAKESDGPR